MITIVVYEQCENLLEINSKEILIQSTILLTNWYYLIAF